MSYKRAVASNTVYQIINKFITAGSTLLISILITRLLGAEIYGEYSIVSTYVITYFLLSDFGVNAIVVQEFAKDQNHAKENFAKILTLRIAFGLVLMLFAFLTLTFYPYSEIVKVSILISLPLVLFNSISRASALIFQSFLRYDYQAWSSVWGSLLTLIFVGFSILLFGNSLAGIVIATALGGLITASLSIYYVREYLAKTARWVDFDYWKYVLLDAFPMGMALTLNVLMVHTDRLMLSILSTPYSVGIYSLSYKIFDVVLVLPTFFMNAVYPVLVKLKAESEERYRLVGLKVFVFLLFTSLLLSVSAIVVSPYLIPAIWGSEMIDSIVPFNILMAGIIFFFLTAPLSWVALIEGKKNWLMYIYGVAFIFNAIFNWMFIPQYDYYAAALITVLTEFIVLVILVLITGRGFVKYLGLMNLKDVFVFRKYVKP